MVAGTTVDQAAVGTFAAPSALVIAHNASFDRKFAERLCEVFKTKAWACSMSQIDWLASGFQGTRLPHLAGGAGFFYEQHRAVDDCQAAIALLATPLPDGTLPLAQLLERARLATVRIWAEHSPFELKDRLKARGYTIQIVNFWKAYLVRIACEFNERTIEQFFQVCQFSVDPKASSTSKISTERWI